MLEKISHYTPLFCMIGLTLLPLFLIFINWIMDKIMEKRFEKEKKNDNKK